MPKRARSSYKKRNFTKRNKKSNKKPRKTTFKKRVQKVIDKSVETKISTYKAAVKCHRLRTQKNHPPLLAVHVFRTLSMSRKQRKLRKNFVTEGGYTPQSVGNSDQPVYALVVSQGPKFQHHL